MRNSETIYKEIEHKRRLIKKHEERMYALQREVRTLENTFRKAHRKEVLAKSGVSIKINKVSQSGRLERMALWKIDATIIETGQKLTWLTIKKKFRPGQTIKKTPGEVEGILDANKKMLEKKRGN